MNLLQTLYCNQYYDLKQQGKEYAANKNGNITVTVALLCNVLTVILLLAFFSGTFAHSAGGVIKSYSVGGKTTGRIIALVLMAVIFPIVRYTIGTKENYDKTIATFESLPEEEQKAISKRGMIYFFASIGMAIVSGVVLAL